MSSHSIQGDVQTILDESLILSLSSGSKEVVPFHVGVILALHDLCLLPRVRGFVGMGLGNVVLSMLFDSVVAVNETPQHDTVCSFTDCLGCQDPLPLLPPHTCTTPDTSHHCLPCQAQKGWQEFHGRLLSSLRRKMNQTCPTHPSAVGSIRSWTDELKSRMMSFCQDNGEKAMFLERLKRPWTLFRKSYIGDSLPFFERHFQQPLTRPLSHWMTGLKLVPSSTGSSLRDANRTLPTVMMGSTSRSAEREVTSFHDKNVSVLPVPEEEKACPSDSEEKARLEAEAAIAACRLPHERSKGLFPLYFSTNTGDRINVEDEGLQVVSTNANARWSDYLPGTVLPSSLGWSRLGRHITTKGDDLDPLAMTATKMLFVRWRMNRGRPGRVLAVDGFTNTPLYHATTYQTQQTCRRQLRDLQTSRGQESDVWQARAVQGRIVQGTRLLSNDESSLRLATLMGSRETRLESLKQSDVKDLCNWGYVCAISAWGGMDKQDHDEQKSIQIPIVPQCLSSDDDSLSWFSLPFKTDSNWHRLLLERMRRQQDRPQNKTQKKR